MLMHMHISIMQELSRKRQRSAQMEFDFPGTQLFPIILNSLCINPHKCTTYLLKNVDAAGIWYSVWGYDTMTH